MLPADDYKSIKNNFGLTLEGIGHCRVSVLATSLKTAELISMDGIRPQTIFRFARPKTNKGGLCIAKNNEKICFIFVDENGDADLRHHWIPKEDILCSILPAKNGVNRYCLKVIVKDNVYLSDSDFSEGGGEYVVSDTTLLCQFLVGEVDESVLQEAAEKQVEELSLQEKFEKLKLKYDHNLVAIQDYTANLAKTSQELMIQKQSSENLLARMKEYVEYTNSVCRYVKCTLGLMPEKPWFKKNLLIRKGLEEAMTTLELMMDLKKDNTGY